MGFDSQTLQTIKENTKILLAGYKNGDISKEEILELEQEATTTNPKGLCLVPSHQI